MLDFLKNMGMEVFIESDETIEGLIRYTLENGEVIHGYNDYIYVNHHLGNVQLIATAKVHYDQAEFVDFNVHASGNAIWEVRIHEMNVDFGVEAFRRIVVTSPKKEEGGLAVVNVVNSEVLPSYEKDEIIRLQMLAFPIEINYFKNEDAYANSDGCKNKNGKIFALADGMLFPAGLFSQSEVKDEEEKQDLYSYMQVRGTVKRIFMGRINLGEETYHPFVKCIIDTQLGELEIIHTIDMVDKEMQQYMKEGATVSSLCVLSGDAAIDDYDHGYICDAENNLKVLHSAFGKGNADYLRNILSDDAEYYSETSKKHFIGKDEIIEWFHYVQNERNNPCMPRYATITESNKNAKDTKYDVGTRCLALAYNNENEYENLVFIDSDDESKVKRILVSKGFGYIFNVDVPPENDLEFSAEPMELIDAMLARANLLMLKEDLKREELDQIIKDNRELFESHIVDMSEKLNLNADEIIYENNAFKRIFGYFFAMSVVHKETRWEFDKDECFSDSLPKSIPVDKAEQYVRAREDGENLHRDVDLPEIFADRKREYNAFEVMLALQAIAQKYE